MKRTLLPGIIGVIAAAVPVYAHHSFASEFIESQSISIEGDVREFQFRNPHAILLVDARDAAGHVQTYAAEWAGAGRLGGMGIDAATLKPGDHLIVTGSPGRNAKATARLTGKTLKGKAKVPPHKGPAVLFKYTATKA